MENLEEQHCLNCGATIATHFKVCLKCGTFLGEERPPEVTRKPADMTVKEALFSFEGRMCRRDYWLKGVLVLLPIGILNNILVFGVNNDDTRSLSIIIGILGIWMGLALLVKRLHDRNRSGWFAATLLIPIANIVFAIWILVEVWFLRGTVGPNRFGDDPVQEPS